MTQNGGLNTQWKSHWYIINAGKFLFLQIYNENSSLAIATKFSIKLVPPETYLRSILLKMI